MKPHPGIRKTVKWGGAVVTVLLVVVWVGSGWWRVGYQRAHAGGGVIGGRVGLWWQEQPIADRFRGWNSGSVFAGPQWRWWFERNWSRTSWDFRLPLWMLTVLVASVTAVAWRLDILARRRARLNHCSKCGYDRAGLGVGAVCPECGAGAG